MVGSLVLETSAITIVDEILKIALNQSASDIHFESIFNGLKVRFRIDGLLHDHKILSTEFSQQVLARIKILSRLDVAEKRLPQDGKFSINLQNRSIDFRISSFPGLYGEKIVIRILERTLKKHSLGEVGFDQNILQQIKLLIQKSTGFFLVVGPTGAGKTTTLYSILSSINSPEKNLITLEDPIEYNIENVTQGQIQKDIGFTFAKGIRSILRQDPDIIMIGEIRDVETAEIAIQAALTGHLVLSTAHTNDSVSAIIRLLDMGIPAFLINATISGILAQRLVRILCPSCKYETKPDSQEADFLKYNKISVSKNYKSTGCKTCDYHGYKERIGIFELLIFTQKLKKLISLQPSYDELIKCALEDGLIPLQIDCTKKIEAGITTISELIRVI